MSIVCVSGKMDGNLQLSEGSRMMGDVIFFSLFKNYITCDTDLVFLNRFYDVNINFILNGSS